MKKFKIFFAALVLGLGTFSQVYADNDVLKFGVLSPEKPSSDVMIGWQNVASAMENASGDSIKLTHYTSSDKIVHDLTTGIIGIAYLKQPAAIRALKKSNAIQLLATALTREPVTGQSTKVYTSYIVVAKNSPISRLRSLKNKKIAFVSADSVSGRIQVDKELAKAGVTNVHWVKYNSLDEAFDAVHDGEASAVGVWDHALLSREDQENFKVIDTIKNLPNPGLYVNVKIVSTALQKKLMTVLPDTKGPYNIIGFVKPTNKLGTTTHWKS